MKEDTIQAIFPNFASIFFLAQPVRARGNFIRRGESSGIFFTFEVIILKERSTMHITRRERFNAAHRLFRADWPDEKNEAVFGKCSNPNWHGHNYILYVTVDGKINPETGFVTNLKDLSRIIREKVIDKVDHKNLNIEVDFMRNKIVSTENIAVAIWEQLEPEIRSLGSDLYCIKLVETENNFVEYYGE